MNGWIEAMPAWFKVGAVIFGLIGIGATLGKTAADYTGHAALLAIDKAILIEVQKQTCIQVSQLRHSDWTLCLIAQSK